VLSSRGSRYAARRRAPGARKARLVAEGFLRRAGARNGRSRSRACRARSRRRGRRAAWTSSGHHEKMSESLEQRLTELEVRIAFIENAVQALDAAVAAQDRALVQFRRESELLRGELMQVRTALAHDAREEPPPPHY